MKQSFYDWCVDNNRMDLKDRFDEEKNGCSTTDVAYGSAQKMFFKCPRGLHESELHQINVITRDVNAKIICKRCNSIAQVIIDRFGEDYLWQHWHESNKESPWDIRANAHNVKVNLQCLDVDYHIYKQDPSSFTKGIGCSCCNGKTVHPNDSFAAIFPEMIARWSKKNTKTPWEYAAHSNKMVWFKCPCGKHPDYPQTINNAVSYDFSCRKCYDEILSIRISGENNPFWKGGINNQNDNLRHKSDYKNWRTSVYERDNYTCQCCGKQGKLNAHHLVPFADCEELRYNIDNGLTLCVDCHDATKKGSFHNLYGTYDNTPDQLREYILNKSNIDIYITHPEILSLNNTKLSPTVKEENINE